MCMLSVAPRVGARGLEPRGHPGKRDLLGASEWPTFFSRSVKNEHTAPRPLKSLPGASESPSGPLRGPGIAPKGPQNLWTPEPGSAPCVPQLGMFWLTLQPQSACAVCRSAVSKPSDCAGLPLSSLLLSSFGRSIRPLLRRSASSLEYSSCVRSSQGNLDGPTENPPMGSINGFYPATLVKTAPTMNRYSKKPLTRVSKRVPGIYGKRGLERGWPAKVGKGLAKGWRRVGEGLAKGQRISLHPPISEFPRIPFRDTGL